MPEPEPPADVERKQCNVRLPVDLIEAIDVRRAQIGEKGISRDQWMENVARDALARVGRRGNPSPTAPRLGTAPRRRRQEPPR